MIDKDLTAALLAEELGAETADHADGRPLRRARLGHAPPRRRSTRRRPAELRELSFAAGSMGPKIEAACRFVERTGGEAVIGSLAELDAVSRGEAGTRILAVRARSRFRSSTSEPCG